MCRVYTNLVWTSPYRVKEALQAPVDNKDPPAIPAAPVSPDSSDHPAPLAILDHLEMQDLKENPEMMEQQVSDIG